MRACCLYGYHISLNSWWRHQMEAFSALLALCAGNSPVPGEFPAQRPVTRSFDVFFDLRLNKRLSKQSWCWLFETLSRSFWRNCNVNDLLIPYCFFNFTTGPLKYITANNQKKKFLHRCIHFGEKAWKRDKQSKFTLLRRKTSFKLIWFCFLTLK